MNLPKSIQTVSASGAEEEAPIAASFAGTLRAFSRRQSQETALARPSVAPLDTKARPSKPPVILLKNRIHKANPKESPSGDSNSNPGQALAGPKPSHLKLPPLLTRLWAWLQKQKAFSAKKQLRVSDTVSLGEKRFVALVHVEGQKFLIGGGASGVSLLAELNSDAGLDSESSFDPDEETQVLKPVACAGGRSK